MAKSKSPLKPKSEAESWLPSPEPETETPSIPESWTPTKKCRKSSSPKKIKSPRKSKSPKKSESRPKSSRRSSLASRELSKEARTFVIQLAKSGSNYLDIRARLNVLYGRKPISKATIYRLITMVKSGKETTDKRCFNKSKVRVRTKDVIDRVRQLVRMDESISMERLAKEVKISKQTAFYIVKKDLKLVKKDNKWIQEDGTVSLKKPQKRKSSSPSKRPQNERKSDNKSATITKETKKKKIVEDSKNAQKPLNTSQNELVQRNDQQQFQMHQNRFLVQSQQQVQNSFHVEKSKEQEQYGNVVGYYVSNEEQMPLHLDLMQSNFLPY